MGRNIGEPLLKYLFLSLLTIRNFEIKENETEICSRVEIIATSFIQTRYAQVYIFFKSNKQSISCNLTSFRTSMPKAVICREMLFCR